MSPLVAVVILNWNGKQDTLECLSSVLANDYENFFVVVADNGSQDGSVAAIRTHFPGVVVMENGANLGFAEGNNRGIRVALEMNAASIVLLNNDTTVAQDWLSSLAKAATDLPPETVLGAKIFYARDPEIIWHFGAHWNNRTCRFEIAGRGATSDQYPALQQVDLVIGCCMWLPRQALQKVGLLEPAFFLNYEETDWCERAKRLDIPMYSVPDAHMWHKISASFVGKPHNAYFIFRNRLLWLERNFSGREYWRRYIKMVLPEHVRIFRKLWLRSLQLRLQGFLGMPPSTKAKEKVRFYRAAIAGINDYRAHRFGNCPAWILGDTD